MAYLIPAAYTGMSSWQAHRNRRPPSTEPGTDYYMPTGTPLGAPAKSRVVAIGGSIHPATGRFVVLDDGTRWLRFLHLSKWRCSLGDELDAGDTFADSGASGYGSEFFGEPSRNAAFWANTGGDHVHVTAFEGRGYPSVWNGSGTVDFHALTGGKIAGGASFTDQSEEDDMPIMVKANVNIYVLSPGQIKLFDDTRQVVEMKAAGVRQHDLVGTTAQQNQAFVDLLDGFGIPQSIDGQPLFNGKGWVLNPEGNDGRGAYEENGMWNWDRQARARLRRSNPKK